MPWKIVEINNSTKKYQLKRHSGHTVNIQIPEEHRGAVTGQAFVKAVCDAHEAVITQTVFKKIGIHIACTIGGAAVMHLIHILTKI
jgi:adenosine/AMP kinase